MHKIRIKRQPQKGDQRDFSLVNNMIYNVGPGDANTEVKNTMTAIDRKDANVEVEGGETVVGDINGDGFLEHMSFVGKRHSKGGMPVNLPEGSFIFSDTKKLRIKDKELLSKVFGMGNRKGGYTPAEIAKKYQINEYIQVLKDENADPLKKRTAAEMLKTNTEMLSKLALVQESMKGFPDGIPALAESAAMGMQGGPEQEAPAQPEARYGGRMGKYPDGGPIKYTPNTVIYLNGVPFRYVKHEDNWGWGNGDKITFKTDDGKRTYVVNSIKLGEILDQYDKGKYAETGVQDGKYKRYYVGTTPQTPDYYSANTSAKLYGQQFNKGTKFYAGNTQYEVADPNAAYVGNQSAQVETDDMGVSVPIQGGSYNKPSLKVYKLDAKGNRVGNAFVLHPDELQTSIKNNSFDIVSSNNKSQSSTAASAGYGNDMVEEIKPVNTSASIGSKAGASTASGKLTAIGDRDYTLKGRDFQYRPAKDKNGTKYWAFKEDDGNWYAVTNQTSVDRLNKHYGFDIQLPGSTPTQTTTTKTVNTAPVKKSTTPTAPKQGGYDDANALMNSFALGGYIPEYLLAGEVDEPAGGPGDGPGDGLTSKVGDQKQMQQSTNQRIDPNQEIFVRKDMYKGKPVTLYYKGNEKIVKDEAGNIIERAPRTDGNKFEQYGSQNINQILAQNPNVRYTNTNFGSFGRQPNVKGTGIYLSSGNAQARSNNDLSPEEWKDFQDRHGDWIEKEYPGGFAKYQQDLRASRESGDKAAAWFQDKVNEKSMKEFGVPYFQPLNGKEDTPYKRDSKFGQVTYSVPRFFEMGDPKKDTDISLGTPKPLVAYYCVENEDGTKNVQSVTYNEGEQPVPPTGKNVSSAFADQGSAEKICAISPQPGGTPNPAKKPSGPWWLQDIVNYVGATTDQVNRYGATQGSVDLQTPGYDLLDPTRQIANIQEQDARTQQQIENSVDGNVGLATRLGSTGDSIGHSANILGQYENANIGIVNNAYDKNAQIMNQEIGTNEAGRVKYVEDNATLNQQIDNALNKKKWRQIAAFNNGTTNWFRKKQMEQVLFPEVYIDPIMGDVSVTPGMSNREMFGPDVYVNPMTGQKGSTAGGYTTDQVNTAWKQYYDEALPVRGEEEARKYATKMTETMMNKSTATPDWRTSYANAFSQGSTLPGQAYGGEFELPWEEI